MNGKMRMEDGETGSRRLLDAVPGAPVSGPGASVQPGFTRGRRPALQLQCDSSCLHRDLVGVRVRRLGYDCNGPKIFVPICGFELVRLIVSHFISDHLS